MSNKAIFLDRDGTLNNDDGHYYIWKPEDLRINEGVPENLKKLKEKGYLLIVISNQGGIGKGEYSKEDTDQVHDYFNQQLSDFGVNITEFYYCPHHESTGKCLCRKPKALLIEKAIAKYRLDRSKCIMIGDSPRDIESANKAGINSILIRKNTNLFHYIQEILIDQ